MTIKFNDVTFRVNKKERKLTIKHLHSVKVPYLGKWAFETYFIFKFWSEIQRENALLDYPVDLGINVNLIERIRDAYDYAVNKNIEINKTTGEKRDKLFQEYAQMCNWIHDVIGKLVLGYEIKLNY